MRILFISLVLGCLSFALAQPSAVDGRVRFTYPFHGEKSVSLVGDFNGWSKDEDPLVRLDSIWLVSKPLQPGIFQYKFVIDAGRYENDPRNPVTIENYNKSGYNSVFVLTANNEVLLSGKPPIPRSNPADEYPSAANQKPLFLNIIWHQHQPLYVNPEKDQLTGPWVRTHATKDYYDMAAILRQYPNVHVTINLTSSLLLQLREYYVRRLGPFIDTKKNTIDVKGFLKKWKGKTDPWIDLALKPTNEFTEQDKDYLYRNTWSAFGMSEVMMERFPQYLALRQKLEVDQMPGFDIFTEQEMREIKFWFYLAYFDPDFLRGAVTLPDGSVCDLSGYVRFAEDRKFYLTKPITEADCQRMVVEAFKVMAGVIPIHRSLRYSGAGSPGQIEIITTPYYHPILPLIYDSEIARTCQPNDSLPQQFSFPGDANAQIARAVKMYTEIFGAAPTGMWPGEGSVAQTVLPLFRNNGILWIASDVKVLQRSQPSGKPNTTPYRFPAGLSIQGPRPIAMVFRDTELSDRIGFKYQNYDGEEAAEDFVQSILAQAPDSTDPDKVITVILDGENAWEWYKKDIDGKEFLHAFYRKLSKLYTSGRVLTITTSEYMSGNPRRGISAHSLEGLPHMVWLWPGSWINANYDTWIGEPEENAAWTYLLRARSDLGKSGLKQPPPASDPPERNSREWHSYMAWEEMYAAEGSDWFWWYGTDQSAPAGDKPFDDAFRIHLRNIYKSANLAGAKLALPDFAPIISDHHSSVDGQGVMAQSRSESTQSVVFTCDASAQPVAEAIFIAGDLEELGEWTPNAVRMYDDGTHGDVKAHDDIWSLGVDVLVGKEVHYKYTNSGTKGQWTPGEEFPSRHRTFAVPDVVHDTPIIITDIFGQ